MVLDEHDTLSAPGTVVTVKGAVHVSGRGWQPELPYQLLQPLVVAWNTSRQGLSRGIKIMQPFVASEVSNPSDWNCVGLDLGTSTSTSTSTSIFTFTSRN
jgi:hypothetical protein